MENWDNSRSGFPSITSPHTFHSSSGSLAMLAAIRHASSRAEVRSRRTSIRFMASGHGCYRFDLSGELLELREELVVGDAGEHNSPSDNSVCYRRIVSDGFVKSSICEGNRYVAIISLQYHYRRTPYPVCRRRLVTGLVRSGRPQVLRGRSGGHRPRSRDRRAPPVLVADDDRSGRLRPRCVTWPGGTVCCASRPAD